MERQSRVTLRDLARAAGVSVATVDRVLNARTGVRAETVSRVEAIMTRVGYRTDALPPRLARDTARRFRFILPSGANTFMGLLDAQIARTAEIFATYRVFIETHRVDVFDPRVLAHAIAAADSTLDGLAVVALDDPRVRAAIDDAVARGLVVVTLVSDVPTSRRHRFVGIDNSAAGRTAATLMGRFLKRQGRIGVVVGSMALRDHAERVFGFGQVMAAEFPECHVLPVFEGRDDVARNSALIGQLLHDEPGLVGLYNVGAGNRGIARALEDAGRAGTVTFIGHELTEYSRRFLLSGTMAAVVGQEPGHEARSAVRVLLAAVDRQPTLDDQERIRIDIFLRDNLP